MVIRDILVHTSRTTSEAYSEERPRGMELVDVTAYPDLSSWRGKETRRRTTLNWYTAEELRKTSLVSN